MRYGTLLLIAGVALEALSIMRLPVSGRPGAAEVGVYLLAGTPWLYPAARLTRWVQDLPEPPRMYDP